MTPRLNSALYACALAAAIALLYSVGIDNPLVFDDERLTDGTVFGQYGSLMQLKVRLLSFGSFVWIQDILGQGWWKQRIFNVALHIGTALALYALVLALLRQTSWRAHELATKDPNHFASTQRYAAMAGVALWALNPMAVYAVAYLIQRSIVMAMLFVVLAALSFIRGLTSGKLAWHGLALLCYLLAVASKEHAVTAILLSVPLFVFVMRPPMKRIAQVTGIAAVLLLLMGALLYSQYSAILGSAFDVLSRAYALQLEQLKPGITQQLYPLSLINQAAMFFHYGLLWFLPYVGWMSIDLRPAFPLSLLSWQLAGALAWLGLLLGSSWLVLRRTDAWSLAGLAVLMPLLLFVTEFSTVWLQDPLVLYRSYLWSIGVPILLALPLVGHSSRKLYAVVLIVLGVWAASALDRIQSLRTLTSTWIDASAKVDLQGPINAVGRWRPILNLGEAAMFRGDYEEALSLFAKAEALGENIGESERLRQRVYKEQQNAKYKQELDKFAAAEAKGMPKGALYYQRGESEYAMARYAEAFESFTKSLTFPQAPEAEELSRLRQAEAAVASQKYDEALTGYQLLVKQSPDKQRYKVGLSMTYIGKKDYQAALEILNPSIAQRPTAQAHYARALAYFYMNNRSASQQDLEIALRAEPNNPMYQQLHLSLNASKQPALQPAAKSTSQP